VPVPAAALAGGPVAGACVDASGDLAGPSDALVEDSADDAVGDDAAAADSPVAESDPVLGGSVEVDVEPGAADCSTLDEDAELLVAVEDPPPRASPEPAAGT